MILLHLDFLPATPTVTQSAESPRNRYREHVRLMLHGTKIVEGCLLLLQGLSKYRFIELTEYFVYDSLKPSAYCQLSSFLQG